jgi:hypothetical protein
MQVNEIEIHFYQDYGFADASNTYILYDEYNDDGTPAVPENIMFDSLDVYIGVSNEDLSQETVMLYSYEALSYTSIEHPPAEANQITTWTCDEEHNLQTVWIHQDPTNHMFTIIDDVNELLSEAESSGKDTHVYWYRRNYDDNIENTMENIFPGQMFITDGDKYYPAFDEDNNPLFEPDSDTSPRNSEYKELFLDLLAEKDNPAYSSRITRYGGAGWTFIPAATDKFVYTVVPRGNKSREKFKVVI